MQILGLESACYAVDTWRGDEHSGLYGDEVFQEWSTFHDPHFGAFSRLVRSIFDEALTKFDDGSIDLLHIDGYHTYEAVRHDFESWLPKLSASAVVLPHDTNVCEMDFGVWRFWQDLSVEYPCFAFLHGHGLGVVDVGRSLPPDVRLLVEHLSHQSQDAFIIRQFFGTLGEALLRQRDQELEAARIEISQRSGANEETRRRLSETSHAREDSRSLALERQHLQERLELQGATIERQEAALAQLSAERGRLKGDFQSRKKELQLARQHIRDRVKLHEATIRGQDAELARLGSERGRLGPRGR